MKNIFYLSIIFLSGCGLQTDDTIKEKNFTSITLVDTFSNKLVPDTANHITEAEFHPLYMGIDQDSISLNYTSYNTNYQTPNWNQYKHSASTGMDIFVDTSTIIGSPLGFYGVLPSSFSEDSKNGEQKRVDFRGGTKSYPVFLKNLSQDTIELGYGEFIPLLIEAKDSLDNWKLIQEPFMYFCGTGLSHFYLPPGEITVTSCKLFSGDYKTKMRLVYGFMPVLKSNEFEGFMNYTQFEKLEIIYD